MTRLDIPTWTNGGVLLVVWLVLAIAALLWLLALPPRCAQCGCRVETGSRFWDSELGRICLDCFLDGQ